MKLTEYSQSALAEREQILSQQYIAFQQAQLNLDLTRGKPSIEQVALSDRLDGILKGDYRLADGSDSRNYGGLDGIPEAKALAASLLEVDSQQILIGGNSSLKLMYLYLDFAMNHGLQGKASAWRQQGAKFICPVPGYDRHFSVCEALDIEMIAVPMTGSGPDMNIVEDLIANDSHIKGIWCVPKYSNPSGETYSHDTVERIAALAIKAGDNFRVMWDNAYLVHDLDDKPDSLSNIIDIADKLGTTDNIFITASSSKMTFAGAGLAFAASSKASLNAFKNYLSAITIGPDKVNQLRHVRFFKNLDGIKAHMRQHAKLIAPKFNTALAHLEQLKGKGIAKWSQPHGGYFISFDSHLGIAAEIIQLTAEAGVKLTPAGATSPYGHDPDNKNLRLAPTYPSLKEVDQAMQIFVVCAELASIRKLRQG